MKIRDIDPAFRSSRDLIEQVRRSGEDVRDPRVRSTRPRRPVWHRDSILAEILLGNYDDPNQGTL
jgi:hypothetical protein